MTRTYAARTAADFDTRTSLWLYSPAGTSVWAWERPFPAGRVSRYFATQDEACKWAERQGLCIVGCDECGVSDSCQC